MELPIFQVDAFTDRVFRGNPAAVMPLPGWLDDTTLQAIAMENNLSETAFLVEVKQAGIFNLSGFSQQEMGKMLGAYCPNLLFPYAREVVSDLVTKGSFPQLLLTPVNFDALYAQHQQKLAQQAAAPDTKQ